MMMETIMSRSLRLMFSGSVALGIGMLAQPTFAQEAPDTATAAPVQRVEITGSAIKRIQKEGSLPVQVLTQEEIRKSGSTTATELIQNLPAMQGFTTSSMSINGGGGGTTSAALHSLPSKYTLVLLDGQRMAGENLESIPLDAVERVEILTDGASALYGSDAIAGVVNFVLKKNKTDGDAFVTTSVPQQSGGRGWNAGISKGWGDLDKDNFNILATYSHDYQQKLMASERNFSKQGGYFDFSVGGNNYLFNQRTGNTTPANINFKTTDGNSYTINPYYAANGNCGSPLAGVVQASNFTQCRFNYAATVEDLPETKRDAGLLKGIYKINDDTNVWGTLLLSRVQVTGQFAPSAQPLGISPTQFPTLYNTYIQPLLTANGETFKAGSGSIGFRSVSLGGRADDFEQDTRHLSFGFNTAVSGWDLTAAATLSHATNKDIAAGGYSDFNQFSAIVATPGALGYDPIMNTGASNLNSALLTGQEFSHSTTDVNTIKVGAQHNAFELPGGTSIVSINADLTKTHGVVNYSSLILSGSGFSTQPASSDFPIGGSYGQVPWDASRTNEGLSGEILLPIADKFEGNLAARYDSYSKTHSGYNFATTVDPVSGLQNQTGAADLGNSFSAPTYKLSMRWTPKDNVLVRGSYGTGFKAPDMGNIAGPLTYYGSTVGSYKCPDAYKNSIGCPGPGTYQYDLLSGANGTTGDGGLKAEKSKQWTLGFRVEPGYGLSVGADLWNVQIKNQVLGSIPENTGFADPATYASLFVAPYADPAGFSTIAYKLEPLNGGVANYQGIDWDFSGKQKTSIGNVSGAFTGTYMMKQNYTFQPDTPTLKAPVLTDLGTFGPDDSVVFRVQMHAMLSLASGSFTNTVQANYKSGYHDQTYGAADGVVSLIAANGTTSYVDMSRQVGSYTTFDWQGKYDYSKSLNFTAGIRNMFDRSPPLTLQNAGGGNQVGYDGRYTDPLGRSFYLTGHYKF